MTWFTGFLLLFAGYVSGALSVFVYLSYKLANRELERWLR